MCLSVKSTVHTGMKGIFEHTTVITSAAFEVGCLKKLIKENDEQTESWPFSVMRSVIHCLYNLIHISLFVILLLVY